MAPLRGVKAKFEAHPQYDIPRHIYDIDSRPSRRSARIIADGFLKKITKDLKIKANLSQLKFDKVKKTIFGSQVLWQQYYEGSPISGAWIKVDINKDGKVFNVVNELVPVKALATARKKVARRAPLLSKEEANTRALELAQESKCARAEILGSDFVYCPYDGIPAAAWKVLVQITSPRSKEDKSQDWKLYLDARSGDVLAKIDLLKKFEGKGKVFDPNPVVTLNELTLEDNSSIPAAVYIQVALSGQSSKTGVLDGAFVSTKRTVKRVKKKDLNFLFTRKQRAFKEVMVYFHIDRAQRYIQSLGFKNVLNHLIEANIDGQRDDNSHYSPTTKSLTFGTGGVDDAEDAEIILHEYGHAVQDDQVPGWGERDEGGAMGEGFWDYLAGSFFSDSKPVKLASSLGHATFVSSWRGLVCSREKPGGVGCKEHVGAPVE